MTSSKDLPPSTQSFFHTFIYNQFRAKPQWPPKGTDLTGKVAVVTGANTGLGFEAARQLLTYKLSHVILAVRSLHKGDEAAAKLRTQFPNARIDVWNLDMTSYDSIQSFVKRIDTDLERLDIAILNAGVGRLKYHRIESTDHEEVMQVNYLSTVLLCILLLPALKAKSPKGESGRMTIVSAALSLTVPLPQNKPEPLFPTFDLESNFKPQAQYNMSKMLAHMFLYKLEEYVSADDVIVNLADPAYVKGTQLARDIPTVVIPLAWAFGALFGRTVEVGASTSVDAVVGKGRESHGCFLMSWEIHP